MTHINKFNQQQHFKRWRTIYTCSVSIAKVHECRRCFETRVSCYFFCRIVETKWMDDNLNFERLRKAPIMIYANRADCPEPMAEDNLKNMRGKPYTLCPSLALSGPGADARTQWLADVLKVARNDDTRDQTHTWMYRASLQSRIWLSFAFKSEFRASQWLVVTWSILPVSENFWIQLPHTSNDMYSCTRKLCFPSDGLVADDRTKVHSIESLSVQLVVIRPWSSKSRCRGSSYRNMSAD